MANESGMFGEVIFAYTRKQALEDGTLIDVTATAKEAGFKYPVAVTSNLWNSWIEPPEEAKQYGQSEKGRLWDVLFMAACAARKAKGDMIEYDVIFQNRPPKLEKVRLWAVCGHGDQSEPVITVMLPEDY